MILANGHHAQLNVEEEIRREPEPAVILPQHTVVLTVKEMLRKHKNVTQKSVLVSLLIACSFEMNNFLS